SVVHTGSTHLLMTTSCPNTTLFRSRRRQRDSEPMALQNVNERMVKTFAVREHRRHELGGIITLEPSGLIRLDSVGRAVRTAECRSEEHTSELQSQSKLVCRLLLEKK